MVAHRERIKEVILPIDNEADVKNLPKDITEGINFRYVHTFSEAFEYLFPEQAAAKKNVSASAWVQPMMI